MDIDTVLESDGPTQASLATRKRARSLSPGFQQRDAKRPNRTILVAQRALTPLGLYSPAHSPYDQLSSQAEGLHLATPRNSPPELYINDAGMEMLWQEGNAMQQDDPMSQDSIVMREDVQQSSQRARPPSLPRSASVPPAPNNARRCQRFALGYREDCELCRKKTPNHYVHFV